MVESIAEEKKEKKETKEENGSGEDNLPIYDFKDEIVNLVKNNLFCIITGETGSGKSTQIA